SSAAPSAAATGRSAGWRGRRVSRAGRARKTGGSWRQGRFPANGQYWVRGDNFPPGQEPAPGYGILCGTAGDLEPAGVQRSEEHTSELQSRENLVCRLLLE